VPMTALTFAFVSARFKRKIDDKKKIQVFFEVSGIAIKKDDKIHYPKFKAVIGTHSNSNINISPLDIL
ncbi:hypothetical protein ACUN90_25065, partial [Escherichia sp. SP-MK2]